MAKLKGTKKLNKYINEYVKQFGVKAKLDNEFWWETDTNKIYYSLTVCENHNRDFQKFCEDEFGLKYNCDIFLLDLYHELGHYFTNYLLTDEEESFCYDLREYLETKEKLTNTDYYAYYLMTDEYRATEWAVNYINTHEKEIAKFYKGLQKRIIKFYKKNNVECVG